MGWLKSRVKFFKFHKNKYQLRYLNEQKLHGETKRHNPFKPLKIISTIKEMIFFNYLLQ